MVSGTADTGRTVPYYNRPANILRLAVVFFCKMLTGKCKNLISCCTRNLWNNSLKKHQSAQKVIRKLIFEVIKNVNREDMPRGPHLQQHGQHVSTLRHYPWRWLLVVQREEKVSAGRRSPCLHQIGPEVRSAQSVPQWNLNVPSVSRYHAEFEVYCTLKEPNSQSDIGLLLFLNI